MPFFFPIGFSFKLSIHLDLLMVDQELGDPLENPFSFLAMMLSSQIG
jgi:hypothetical protein